MYGPGQKSLIVLDLIRLTSSFLLPPGPGTLIGCSARTGVTVACYGLSAAWGKGGHFARDLLVGTFIILFLTNRLMITNLSEGGWGLYRADQP